MKKIFTSMFAAALLCATTAMADETITSWSFDDANSPVFTTATNSTADYTYDSPIGAKTGKFLNVWGQNGTCGAITATITETDMTTYGQWTLEFDWAVFSGCNKKAGATSVLDAAGNAIITITDAANWNKTCTVSDGNELNCYPCEKTNRISANTGSVLTAAYWYHITIVGSASGIKFTAAPYNADGELQAATITKSQLSGTNASPKTLSLKPGSCGSVAVDNLVLTATNEVQQSYNYTVKYVCNGVEIKDAVTRSDIEGTAIEIPAIDKASFFNADNTIKYIYVSDDSEGKTVTSDGATVVTVTFREAADFNYTINGVINGETRAIKTGKGKEGETVTITYPTYQIAANGTLYSASKLSSDKKGYYFGLEMTEDNLTTDIAYSTKVADGVVFCKEAEDIEGLTACDNSNTPIRSSNGASAYAADGAVVIATLPAGTYKLTSVACDAAGKTASAVFYYTVGSDTIFTHTCSSINWDTKTSDELTFAGETEISLAQGGKAGQGIDVIYIQNVKFAEGKADLKTSIDAANEFLATMEEGDDKATLEEAISVAQSVYDRSSDVDQINSAKVALDAAVENAKITTSISNVNVVAKTSNAKFVENGAVVIVKNGQKFNVAGAQLK